MQEHREDGGCLHTPSHPEKTQSGRAGVALEKKPSVCLRTPPMTPLDIPFPHHTQRWTYLAAPICAPLIPPCPFDVRSPRMCLSERSHEIHFKRSAHEGIVLEGIIRSFSNQFSLLLTIRATKKKATTKCRLFRWWMVVSEKGGGLNR